jgi:hypothetical protein
LARAIAKELGGAQVAGLGLETLRCQSEGRVGVLDRIVVATRR